MGSALAAPTHTSASLRSARLGGLGYFGSARRARAEQRPSFGSDIRGRSHWEAPRISAQKGIIEAPLGGSTAAQSFWSREGCDKEGSLEEESLEI